MLIFSKEQNLKSDFELTQKREESVIAFSLFFLFLVIKILTMNQLPVWADEIAQAQFNIDSSPLFTAASQQQPPLGYYFSFWSVKFLGQNDVGIRGYILLISSFSLVQFYWLLRSMKLPLPLSLISAVGLFSVPSIFQFSIEARPIILGIITGQFFINESVIFFKEKINLKLALRVLASSIIFLLSVGFQPPIFILSVFIATLVFFRIIPPKNFFIFNFILILSVVLYVPIQLLIFNQSANYIKAVPLEFFLKFGLNFFDYHKLQIYPKLSYFLVAVFLLVFVFKRTLIRKVSHLDSKSFSSFMEALGFAQCFVLIHFLFTILALIFYETKINYFMTSRYFVLLHIPLFIGLSFYLKAFLFDVSKSPYFIKSLRLFIVFFFVYYFNFFPTIQNHRFFKRQNNWIAFNYFERNLQPNDIVLPFCIDEDKACWDFGFYFGYRMKSSKNLAFSEVQPPYRQLVRDAIDKNTDGKIFLFVNHHFDRDKVTKALSEDFSVDSEVKNLFVISGPNRFQNLLAITRLIANNSSSPDSKCIEYYKSIPFKLVQLTRGHIEIDKSLDSCNWETKQFNTAVIEFSSER